MAAWSTAKQQRHAGANRGTEQRRSQEIVLIA
jgi:hypothetical protein